jgi:general stress protein 26
MSTDNQRDKLRDILNGSSNAFMVTRSTSHTGLHGRPMATAKIEGDLDVIYFATQRDSGKVDELEKDPRVFLGYANSTGSDWATVNGSAKIIDDKALNKRLWQPIWKNWFSGPDDPNLVMIAVQPETAEYWDQGSKALALVKFAVAAVTGKHINEGDHAKVTLAAPKL